MSEKVDILVLGATGYTGRLITKYLANHPQKAHFSLALGARTASKLRTVAEECGLQNSVKLISVDVTNPEDVENAVKQTRVVINTVGPYWTWGTPVVQACIRNSVHYVDLTGETAWVKQIIRRFDYSATKTGSVIVPSCGFDSIPSDISAHLANKTLKSLHLSPGNSTSSQAMKGGVSGGTISSAFTTFEKVPRRLLKESGLQYSLSPYVGIIKPEFRAIYKLPILGEATLIGGPFVMAPTNKHIVQRTWGLLEYEAREKKTKEAELTRYGPQFSYDEFMQTNGVVSALLLTTALIIGFGALVISPVSPLRAIAKKLLPQAGEGPMPADLEKGFLKLTNVTSAASSPDVQVKTVIRGKGDPGYLLTAIMISESALSFILPPPSESKDLKPPGQNNNIHALPSFARQGGILTPMTAFGDVLIKRLEESQRFSFSSSFIGHSKKD
ncbi:saccharopine dehydrogenase [Panaeolus papilionaceus]|nr:saccharopine dehydrogenase [Panaeolus papilionaceus]